MFYNKLKKQAINQLKEQETIYNGYAREGNDLAINLYEVRKSAAQAILRVEEYINSLANTPKEFQKDVAETVLNIQEFREAVRIEKENSSDNIKGASVAGLGTATGGAIAALGPTAAMVIATTFGTASTGVAISALSGAAATNAALAWLGGGALAAGGGGMAAGNALLALAGPIGWGIAGLALVGGGVFASHKNKKAAEEADRLCKEVAEKNLLLQVMVDKLRGLLKSTKELKTGLGLAEFNLFPNDYLKFSDDQKLRLASLINNTKALGIMINERVG